jgi:transcriptional regulator with XRE-family HTH domain
MLDFIFTTHQEICQEIGKRLRTNRMQLNLTQAEVAKRAGVSKGTVSNIESRGQGTLESLVRVLQALGLTQELQPLFQQKPTSIAQLEQLEQPLRKRVSGKRRK